MTLWFVFALMTAAAVFAVLWPLGRQATAARGNELAVYRDQLTEVESDRAAGRIGEAEADAARIEISRRLLAADSANAATEEANGAPPALRRLAAVTALVALPLGSAGLYLALGSPTLPSQPRAERLAAPAEQRSLDTLIAQVEAHLESNPTDGRGWEVLAPVYMRLGRYADAVKAFRNVLAFSAETSERQSNLGEALMAAGQGIVTVDAANAFERAVALDGQNAKARFYLGLAAEQDGRAAEAAKRWRELIAEAPRGAPWREFVRQALARVDPEAAKQAEAAPPPASQPGPTAADVAAAAQMSAGERQAMVRGMVERLAERLKGDGSDLDSWLRLMRAYMVLGERDKARAAATDARRALTGDPEKLRRIDDAAKGLGLDG